MIFYIFRCVLSVLRMKVPDDEEKKQSEEAPKNGYAFFGKVYGGFR